MAIMTGIIFWLLFVSTALFAAAAVLWLLGWFLWLVAWLARRVSVHYEER